MDQPMKIVSLVLQVISYNQLKVIEKSVYQLAQPVT